MNRVQVTYGGREYVIGNRRAADVEREITDAIDSGRAAWLDVNFGSGQHTPCRLLLTEGVTIAVIDFPTQETADARIEESQAHDRSD